MDRKQNIWENTTVKNNDNGYKRTALQCNTKIHNHAWNVFETDIWCELSNNKHVSALMWTQLKRQQTEPLF